MLDKTKIINNSFLELGKIPPQAIELEEAIIGAILIEQGAIDKVFNLIKSESFYKESHRIIYESIVKLKSKSEPIDLLTVVNELKSAGNLEIIGGAYFLTTITNRVESSANIESHARIILEKYIQREIIKVSSELTKSAFEDTTDVFMLVDEMQVKSANIGEKLLSGNVNLTHISKIIDSSLSDLNTRLIQTKEGKLAGITTGLAELNKLTGGWRNSDLIILAARPGMGKTALALHFAKSASKLQNNISFFSLEMSNVRLTDRLLISGSGVNAEKYRNGYLTNEEQDKVIEFSEDLQKESIWIDDSPYVGVNYIKSVCRIQKTKGILDMIIIDYLQLAKPDETYKGNREGEISEISRNLKGLSKELDVPIILLCQLNRMVESRANKKPVLSDLRESGAIEQDADMVLFVYRPSYYDITIDADNNPIAENTGFVIISKNREGQLKDVPFQHNESLTNFYDYNSETPF